MPRPSDQVAESRGIPGRSSLSEISASGQTAGAGWIPGSSAVVVGIGDSIMYGQFASTCASWSRSPTQYPAGSSSWGACSLDRIGYATGATVVNLGRSGACFQSTVLGCSKIATILSTYQSYVGPYVGSHYNGNQYFIFQGGTGEVGNAPNLDYGIVYDNYVGLITWMHQQGVPYNHIALSSVDPTNPSVPGKPGALENPQMIAGWNQTEARVAMNPTWAGQLVIADNYDALRACGYSCYYSDGLHLVDAGYAAQAKAWLNANDRNALLLAAIPSTPGYSGTFRNQGSLLAGNLGVDTPCGFALGTATSTVGVACTFTDSSGDTNIVGVEPSSWGLKVAAGTPALALDSGGQMGLLSNLFIAGTTAQKGSGTTWSNPADRQIMAAIRPYTRGLADVLRLEPVSFRFNGRGGVRDDNRRHVGFVAQDVRNVDTAMVYVSPVRGMRNRLAVDSSDLTEKLVNAVQSLQREIDELKAQLKEARR